MAGWQHPHLAARLAQRVGAEEARVALQALVRREAIEPAERIALFAELAEHFKNLVAFPPETTEGMPDEQYVRNVVDILFRKAPGSPEANVPKRAVEAARLG